MRKVMIMNGKYIVHDGSTYKVQKMIWTPEEVSYETKAEFPTLKEVIDHLNVKYDSIEAREEITEDELRYLYFGFNGLKEKIDKHLENNRRTMYKLSALDLDTILQNMTRLTYHSLEGHLHLKPLFGMARFGNYESLTVEGAGKCFYKPTLLGKNIIKINNSTLTYHEDSYILLGNNSKSLWLEMYKGSRRTVQVNFIPKRYQEPTKMVAF